ncbi:MAG: redoxin domain-containing protein [Chitinophagales bacterium]|nr:redoxin domain-containing protein [Chitinophagales bacterium]
MLKYLLLILGLNLSFSVLAQSPDSTRIDVTLEGLSGGIVRLVGTYGDQNYLADSAFVDPAGHFVIARKKALPAGFYYFLLPGNKNFSFLIDKNEQFFSLKAKMSDLVGSMQVEGCLNTDLLYRNFRFQNAQDPELGRLGEIMRRSAPKSPEYENAKAKQAEVLAQRKAHLDEIYKQYPKSFFTIFKIAGQNPDWTDFRKPNGDIDTMRQLLYYRNNFWNGVDFNDERLLYTPVVVNKLRRFMKELHPQHPDSLILASDKIIGRVMQNKPYFKFFTNWIALQYENGKTTVMDGEAVYVHIIKKYFTKELAFWSNDKEIEGLQKHAWEMEASLLGRKGPDVQAPDINGQLKSIYEIKAPIVVVFMFSPDCEHCQKDAPVIEQLSKKWKSRGVEFFGIAVNTTDKEWRDFVKQNGFTFTNVFDPSNRAIYAKYFVDITPELYILDKNRTIVAKNLKPEQLETIFERELRK